MRIYELFSNNCFFLPKKVINFHFLITHLYVMPQKKFRFSTNIFIKNLKPSPSKHQPEQQYINTNNILPAFYTQINTTHTSSNTISTPKTTFLRQPSSKIPLPHKPLSSKLTSTIHPLGNPFFHNSWLIQLKMKKNSYICMSNTFSPISQSTDKLAIPSQATNNIIM